MVAVANRRILVLNKLWSAVNTVGVERGMNLLCNSYANGEPKARVVDPWDNYAQYTWEDWCDLVPKADEPGSIQGVNRRFRFPEVILLTRYDKFPDHRVKFSRREIYRRDGYQCQYCGERPGTEELTIDHIVPRCQGGETTWLNCTLACVDCNTKKADKSLEQSRMKLLSQPTKPKFSLFKGDPFKIPDSWKMFVSEAYWNVELKNDEK